jgi:hypothetical protein
MVRHVADCGSPQTPSRQDVTAAAAAAAPCPGRERSLPPLFFFGTLFAISGFAIYFVGIAFSVIRLILQLGTAARMWNQAIMWYSGIPFTLGVALAALDLGLLLPAKRRDSRRRDLKPVLDKWVTVALTAYNDEQSIAESVADFRNHGAVRSVIVVDNSSDDRTFECASRAGARVVTENQVGYGRCVCRCFTEALADTETKLIVLCEGDMTFRAKDVDKLLAYIDHADIVNGTRIVE